MAVGPKFASNAVTPLTLGHASSQPPPGRTIGWPNALLENRAREAMRASLDLTSLATYANGTTASDVLADVSARIASYPDPAVWIHLLPSADILAHAECLEDQRRAGQFLPLYGVPFAIEDNIDVAGHPHHRRLPGVLLRRRANGPGRRALDAGGGHSHRQDQPRSVRHGTRRRSQSVCLRVFDACDVLVVPTTPALPTLAAVNADSVGWGRKMGYYTNFVNLLRLAAARARDITEFGGWIAFRDYLQRASSS